MTEAVQEDLIDDYRTLETLGSGGFATVYKVRRIDGGNNEVYALKLLSVEKSRDTTAHAQFQNEIKILSSIESEGIVSVVDFGVHKKRPYFVMDYCEGGTLKRRLYETWPRKMSLDDARELGFAIGRALWPAHAQVPAIVHRDIKPQNLLIRTLSHSQAGPRLSCLKSTEELVVGDFGLARHVSLETTDEETVGGFTKGYAPIEQVEGDGNIDASADVYSASAVVMSALLNVPPKQVFHADDFAFADEDFKKCGALETVFRRGLSSDPKKRQPNIREWCEELDAAISQTSTVSAIGLGPTNGNDLAPSEDLTPPDTQSDPTVAKNAAGSQASNSPSPPGTLLGSILAKATRRIAKYRMLVVGVLAGAAIATLLFTLSPQDSTNTELIGPVAGVVGDPAAFFLDAENPVRVWKIDGLAADDLSGSWIVNEAALDSPLLNVTPLAPGTYEIEATASDGESLAKLDYKVADELGGIVRIVGADFLRVGNEANLRLQGIGAGSDITWSAAGSELNTFAIAFTPNTHGTLTVTARTSEVEISRTFTVLP